MLTTQGSTTATTSQRVSIHTLDGLSRKTSAELDALYRAATVSKTLHAADGALVGRMLAVRGLSGALAEPLRRWAASRSFVWEGKTFAASSDSKGVGHNRVFIPGVFGHQNLFPFETSFGPSAIDGKPTLILDYDLSVNPSYIRHIHDEVREVAPGLFLGPAMWNRTLKRDGVSTASDKSLVLWFALDSRLS